MDSSNRFCVRLDKKGQVCVDYYEWLDGPISREEAVNLAAWLLAVADPDQKEFGRVWRRIHEQGSEEPTSEDDDDDRLHQVEEEAG